MKLINLGDINSIRLKGKLLGYPIKTPRVEGLSMISYLLIGFRQISFSGIRDVSLPVCIVSNYIKSYDKKEGWVTISKSNDTVIYIAINNDTIENIILVVGGTLTDYQDGKFIIECRSIDGVETKKYYFNKQNYSLEKVL